MTIISRTPTKNEIRVSYLITSIIVSIIFIYLINSVGASVGTPPTSFTYIKESTNGFQLLDMATPQTNAIFYANNGRYYVFYAVKDDTYAYQIKYSFSDVDDLDNWNDGGAVATVYNSYSASSSYVGDPIAGLFDVVYNSDLDLFHIANVYGANTNDACYFRTYSVSEIDYELDLDTWFYLTQQDDYFRQDGSTAMCLDQNGYPMIVIQCDQQTALDYCHIWIANSTTPTSKSDFKHLEIDLDGVTRAMFTAFPYINEQEMMVIFGDMESQDALNYMIVDYDDTNATVSAYTLSDEDCMYYNYGSGSFNYQNYIFYGASYSETDVCISYVNMSGFLKVIQFDKAPLGTISFNESYTGFTHNSTYYPRQVDVIRDNDEYFIFCNYYYDNTVLITDVEVYVLEDNSGSWDSTLWIDESFDFMQDDYDDHFTYGCFAVPFTTINDEVLFVANSEQSGSGAWCVLASGTITGEETTEPTTPTGLDIDNSMIFILVGIISFMVIGSMLVYAQGKVRL